MTIPILLIRKLSSRKNNGPKVIQLVSGNSLTGGEHFPYTFVRKKTNKQLVPLRFLNTVLLQICEIVQTGSQLDGGQSK